MRNGNYFKVMHPSGPCLVLILPMRNGNLVNIFIPPLLIKFVLILPMRNGNFDSIIRKTSSACSSYPTYEEWKLMRLLKGS